MHLSLDLGIRDGWEFSRPKQAADSTFRFLVEKWKNCISPGFFLKEAFIDKPVEEDVCRCHFTIVHDGAASTDPPLVLKYQWFCGDISLSNFVPIADATNETYWPKNGDIGKVLKVECTPTLGEMDYPPIFAISSRVLRGNGIPKVNLEVLGELIEGSIIRGCAKVACCGGTPGKGVASWLRRKWNSSPVVIVGAEDEEYQLAIDDVDSSLVFMYTPVTEEGAKGEPQYKYTDFVKAALPPSLNFLSIIGDYSEDGILTASYGYVGGHEGKSIYRWYIHETGSDGSKNEIVGATTATYVPSIDVIGSFISVSCEPILSDWARGPMVLSEQIGPIIPGPPTCRLLEFIGSMIEGQRLNFNAMYSGGEQGDCTHEWFRVKDNGVREKLNFLDLILEDGGTCVEIIYTPVRKDGIRGNPMSIVSDLISPSDPKGMDLVIPDYCEDIELILLRKYFGGHEGVGEYIWYRTNHKLEGSELLDISNAFDVVICGTEP